MKRNFRPACLLLVAFWLAAPIDSVRARQSSYISVDDRKAHFKWTDDGETIEAFLEGEVEFDDNDRVASLSSDGRVMVEHRHDDRRRKLEVRPGRGGAPEYTYWLNGREQPLDAAARADVDVLLLVIVRNTGVNAESRTVRLLDEGGVDAVLREIRAIRSSGARQKYFVALVEQGDLDSDELRKVVRNAGQLIASSGDRSRFLLAAAPYVLDRLDVYSVYFEVVDSVPSSGDRSRVLVGVLERPALDRTALTHVLKSAAKLPSSGDRSRVLIAAQPTYVGDPAMRAAYFEAVEGIPSSGDKTRVLIRLIEGHDPSRATMQRVLLAARSIGSSGDKTRVLVAASAHVAGDDALVDTYLDTADTIGSSSDQRRALSALVR